jgi:hypothetical protein
MKDNLNRRTVLKAMGSTGIAVASGLSLTGTAAAYTIDSDLKQTANVTGGQLDTAIDAISPESPLIGLGDTWIDVQNNRNINAIYMVAHAALESAWGESDIAQEKQNIYGFDARDICPAECADEYASFEQCIRQVMEYIDNEYLTPGGTYYEGATLRGMNVHYATDNQWAEKIASIMNDIVGEIDGGGGGGFTDGDRVTPTTALNTRHRPGTESEILATMSAGTDGEIMNGPVTEDGYTWWGVHWLADDIWGWSVERYLNEV